MSQRTKEEIEAIARNMLIEHNMYSIPVDPVVLANKLGIRVSSAEFADPNISGMIMVNGENVELLVNISDSYHRKIFTIAHELGHKILHLENGGKYVDFQVNMYRGCQNRGNKEYDEEIEANQFAAALLMDEELVKSIWPEIGPLYELANLFNVSQSAMGYRIDNLGL